MKLYLVRPHLPANADREAVTARLRACIQPIADLIASSIEMDPGLFGIWHADMGAAPACEPENSFGDARAVKLINSQLPTVLAQCGDPFGGHGMLIRSLVTCRSVRYGFDGEAFLCLPTSDVALVSPDETLIIVEDCSALLSESDWMDGLHIE